MCLDQRSLLSNVTPSILSSFSTASFVLPKYRSGIVGILFLDNIKALHFVGSKVTFQLAAHTLIFSRSLFRLAKTLALSFTYLIGANSVESSAYRYSWFRRCPLGHRWRQRIEEGLVWSLVVPRHWWVKHQMTGQKEQPWWTFHEDSSATMWEAYLTLLLISVWQKDRCATLCQRHLWYRKQLCILLHFCLEMHSKSVQGWWEGRLCYDVVWSQIVCSRSAYCWVSGSEAACWPQFPSPC